ncbi:hypothetical protein HJG60_008884 [Phyllostomus discolor]|uniref:Uncharacterized protein n=1 Tax=Phyllostomus discolor TaxID=89673 RepID=A0A833YWJ9_9CHIR|nr:hypothetical protein HJG60_008884 [Phyllostomus discolor]
MGPSAGQRFLGQVCVCLLLPPLPGRQGAGTAPWAQGLGVRQPLRRQTAELSCQNSPSTLLASVWGLQKKVPYVVSLLKRKNGHFPLFHDLLRNRAFLSNLGGGGIPVSAFTIFQQLWKASWWVFLGMPTVRGVPWDRPAPPHPPLHPYLDRENLCSQANYTIIQL